LRSPGSSEVVGSDALTLYLSAKLLIPAILFAAVVIFALIPSTAFRSNTKSVVAN